jgi:hypothetical protein
MIFTTHHDAPVAFPDSMRVLDATVTREARGSGRVLGPDQRVDVLTALKAMTIWAAYQKFEEDTKGSLTVGKLADFAILSRDPTTGDPRTIDTIKVTETVKEGKSIYRLPADKRTEVVPANIGPMLQVLASGRPPHRHADGSECHTDLAAVLAGMLSGSESLR